MKTTRRRPPAETRRLLLEAADALSNELGPTRVSLEAVAERAGVSKGGLLYHFPTKNALLRALVVMHVDSILAGIEAAAPGCMAPGGPALAGAVATLRLISRRIQCNTAPLAGVLAAMVEDPDFIAPQLVLRKEIHAMFLRCPNPGRAEIVFLAMQGIMHLVLTDPASRTPGDIAGMFERLEAELTAP